MCNWPDDYINKIICGDCFEVMKGIPDGVIDLVVTDPPYRLDLHNGSGRNSGIFEGRDFNCFSKIHDAWNLDVDIPALMNEIRRLQSPINAYVWCSCRQLVDYLTWAAANNTRANVLVWIKSNPMPLNNNTLLSDIEYCVHFTEKGSFLARGLDLGMYSKVFHGSRRLGTGHPTPKPISFMRRHITLSSGRGDIVLDPFVGSGTTAVAAKQLDRVYVGIEIRAEFCQIAEDFLKQEVLNL